MDILPILQLILAAGNVCILGYTLIKFLGKPHTNLEARVKSLEEWRKDTDIKFERDLKMFESFERTNEAITKAVLALIEFELEYCNLEHKEISPILKKAKEDLHDFLVMK